MIHIIDMYLNPTVISMFVYNMVKIKNIARIYNYFVLFLIYIMGNSRDVIDFL